MYCVVQDRIDAIVQQAERFVADNHFDSEAIVLKQQALVARYENLQVLIYKMKYRFHCRFVGPTS